MTDNFDDDLFAHTKMTFGEHLEELRSSLFKAVLSLTVGFLIGLLIANDVVRQIEAPLTRALTNYYLDNAIGKIEQKLNERRERGEKIPELLSDRKNIEELVIKQRLLFEEHFIVPEEVLDDLKREYPRALSEFELTPPATAGQARTAAATTGPATPPATEKTGASAASPSSTAATASKPAPKLLRIYLWHKVEDDDRISPTSLGVQETFMIWIKAAFIAGAIFSSPFVFYFLWQFVAAGLYPHERRYVHVFLPASVGLFLFGALLAFFFVFDPVLNFLFSFNHSLGIDPDPRISEWMSFVLLLPLGFGISFQLPLVMLFLERIGIFSVEAYLSKWRIAVLSIAIASMVLSPGGDPYSMMMMFVPLTLLYFGGVAACYYLRSPNRHPHRA